MRVLLSIGQLRPWLRRAPRAAAWLLLLVIAQPLAAATRDFHFLPLAADHGLAQHTVTALAQDAQGFVWVGTQGGLHRFDGQRYRVLRHDPRDPGSLPESYVTALAAEPSALWIGTYSQSVARLDLRTGRIRRYPPPGHEPLPVLALLAHGGRVWVGTAFGLERLDPHTGGRERVLRLSPVPDPRGLPGQALLAGTDGAVWFACGAGLFRIGPRGGIERIGPAAAMRSLAFDHLGRLWIGGADGLHRLRDDGRTLLRIWPTAGEAESPDVRAIVEAPDRRFWLAVYPAGLRRFDPATGTVQTLREMPLVPASLPEDGVTALLLDRGNGLLWIGGQLRGAAVTDPLGTRFRYVYGFGLQQHDPYGEDSSVRALFEDATGQWWLGTDGGRLLRMPGPEAPAEDFGPRLAALLPPVGGAPRAALRVLAIEPAGNDRAWLGTNRGLLLLDPANRALKHVPLPQAPALAIRSLARDPGGVLWIGTSTQGLLRYDPLRGELRPIGPPQARNGSRALVHAVHVDRRGRVWFGTAAGLGLYEPGRDRLRHFRHDRTRPDSLPGDIVRAVREGSDGTLWLATHAGLSRVRERGGAIAFEHPLAAALGDAPVPVVFDVREAPAGRLWLATDAGVLRFQPASGEIRRYGLRDGLQDLEFNGGATLVLRDGRMLFGGIRGLNLFDPLRIEDSRHMPPLRLLSVRIGAEGAEDWLWSPHARIEMGEAAAILRLRVGALDPAGAGVIRYRYRLDGYDTDWIDNGTLGEITYTRLPAGSYTLHVQATNRDGIWNPAELRLPLRVTPPPWRHPLALAAYALLALAVVSGFGVLLWRQRRSEREHLRQLREREERLTVALWASGEEFWDYDLRTHVLHRLHIDDAGRTSHEFAVTRSTERTHEIHPEDLPRVRDQLRQHLRGRSSLFVSEHRVRNDQGSWTWVRARGRVVERDPATGRALRVAGTSRDITHSRTIERERRISTEVLRSMSEAVVVFDRDFRFVSVNPAFTRMSGYTDAEVLGRSTSLLDSHQHDPEFYRLMRQELERTGRWSGEMWQQRKDGEEFLCAIESSVVLDANGQRSHYVAVLTDITDKKRAEQELRYLANYDTLTSLPNRALLSERLSRAIVRARRQGSRIAVLFLDLDRFKDINDSLGHAAGDRILRAAAARLQQTVGPQHTVARLGGDEFTVVLENIDTAEDAEKVAREIITAFEAPLDIDDQHDVAITPSIGISLYPDHAQVPTDLLKHADTAMYQAKAAGRRTYMRYDEAMDVAIRRRATIATALRKVLDRNELRLVFQPRLSLPQARITGVEALLRWSSPEHGEVPPSLFIPLAEESGLILDIGEWALREACQTLKRWRQHGLDHLSISVNVSALQLLRGDLPSTVARVLDETGLPAEHLELELTESVIMANAAHTASTLRAFRDLGLQLAIDDFGTGYSSLAYLKRLPINTLKIDKEFIGDLTRDADDEAITSTVITMAHSLGLNVVAEGVEEEAQVQFLRQHRCDEVQGYWLSAPLDAHRCLAFIRTWAPTLTAATTP
ncbi:EAL domain-containing protein [Vulcaniibacterium gelatinicum]|uniref:EAL domain-containing protein n=1 Tax=Vulcaniibacterium gelatinicum TaxID=2598725 RepID=UPI0015F2B336|nr:EAL domain-containing protein [Vulcaniibacterium gelatinicum]